jgi:hypothetical protein
MKSIKVVGGRYVGCMGGMLMVVGGGDVIRCAGTWGGLLGLGVALVLDAAILE